MAADTPPNEPDLNQSPPPRLGFSVRLPQGLSAFRHRNYRLYFFGQLVSITGTWMQSLALAWVVLSLTSSPFKLGLVSAIQFLPSLVLGLFAGVLADRLPKRSVLVVTQSSAAILGTIMATLVGLGVIQLWEIYVLSLSSGIVTAFDNPTRQAFVTDMVGTEDLLNAVALNSAVFNTARIIGPAIAGLLLAVVGPAVCFGIDAVSYLAVVAALLMMTVEGIPTMRRGRGMDQLRDGLAYVRRTSIVLRPIILVGAISMFGFNFNLWIPLLAKQDLHTGASGFGILLAALGVGSLAGALSLAFFMRKPRNSILFGAAAIFGVSEIVMFVVSAIPLAISIIMLVLAVMGFTASTTTASANTTIQTNSPDHLRGRVMSVYTTVFTGSVPFGSLIAGAIASAAGTPISIGVGGAVTLATALGLIVTMPSVGQRGRPHPLSSGTGGGAKVPRRRPISPPTED